jgi:hypothetical protein
VPQAVAPAAAILGLLLLLLDLQLILMFVLLIRDGLLQLVVQRMHRNSSRTAEQPLRQNRRS